MTGHEEKRKFISDLALMMIRAHEVGMHETGHAIHEAVKTSGYELERAIKKADKE